MKKPNERTALYRHFNKYGQLLYVGTSLSAVERFREHLNDGDWARDSESMRVQWFETREEAEKAEHEAILAENPKYNIAKRLQKHQEMKSVKLSQEHWEKARMFGNGSIAEGIRRALDAYPDE